MTEVWRDIPGWEGYEASDLGRIRSVDRTVMDRRGFVSQRKGRVIVPSANNSGHEYVSPSRGGRPAKRYVHRLVLKAFVGQCPVGMESRHLDGNPANNKPGNLVWDTRRENTLDRTRHGTHNNGNKTHCKRGHEFTESNIIRVKDGRSCRVCKDMHREKHARTRSKA